MTSSGLQDQSADVKIPFEMFLYPNAATINSSPFQKNVKQLTQVLQWYGSIIECLVCLVMFQLFSSALFISHFAIISAATSTCVKICYVHKITGACGINRINSVAVIFDALSMRAIGQGCMQRIIV